MKIILNLILTVGLPLFSFAQSSGNYLHNRYAIERMANGAGLQSGNIVTMAAPPPGVKGDVYLNKHFSNAVFQLYDGDKIVEGFLAKLDLKQNEFDVMVPHGVKVLKGSMVRSFIFIDSLTKFQSNFVNAREWQIEGAEFSEGFVELLAEGKLTLARRTELIVKKPDFNPALNIGSKDFKFLKKDRLYYIKDNLIFELPGKKNFSKIFSGSEKSVDKYIADNELSLSKIGDLIQIFDFYNEK